MSERTYERISDLPAGTTPIDGTELCELEQDGVSRKFPMSTLAGITAAHEAQHQRGGSDPVGSDEVEAYAIPYLDSSGRIDSRVSDASTTKAGKVQLATDGEESGTKVVVDTDSRLSDARDPTEHGIQHTDGGTDPIPNATTSNSGLMSPTDKTKVDAFDASNLPTAGQKAALAGSYGIPGSENVYVTETDPRIESATGLPVGVPIPVCDDAPALESPFEPMDGQLISDAGSVFNGRRLRNMNGASVLLDLTFTADAGGAYAEIDESDTPAIGLHDWIIGTGIADHSWISNIGLPDIVATSQTVRDYWSLEYHNDELYCAVLNDNIYKMDEYGVFQTTSQASLDWNSIKSFNGELYATVQGVSGNVYKMDEYGVFQTTSQTPGGYQDLFIHNDELYCIVTGSGIYKMDSLGVFSSFLSITGVYAPVSYEGLIVYQTDSINDLMCYNGTGHYLFATQSAAEKARALRVIDGTLFKIDDYSLSMYEGGGIFKAMTATPNARDVILVGDTLYIATINSPVSSPGDVYTIDYSKRLLTISDPSAAGAISCTITNEGRGIIGGAFGSVGDQGQKITGSISSSGVGALFDTSVVWAGALSVIETSSNRKSGADSGTHPSGMAFDTSGSPYARTSADTWGKTKTDAYRMKYYMRIK